MGGLFSEDDENLLKDLDILEKELESLQGQLGNITVQSEHEFGSGVYSRISKDDMQAWLYLTEPMEGQEPYTVEGIMDYLQDSGIVMGYHNSNIKAMVKKKIYNREIVVAEGKEPKDGKDGYFEYMFDTSSHSKPVIREDGSVDYSSMFALSNVRKGDVVAIYHPAEKEENGFTVRGREMRTKPGKELPPLRGKGIANEENEVEYIATMDGRAELKNGRIEIQNQYYVNGDVDYVTGKVEFFGDIVITGNVGTGVVIRAGRNLTVQGTVEAAELYAGGNIILQRGIQGNQKAKINAKGGVMADFIEFATVNAKGGVAANSIIGSDIRAEGKIKVDGTRGVIVGGKVSALFGIEVASIGNESEMKTTVHAGYEKESNDKYKEACYKEEHLHQELVEIVDDMKDLLRKKRLLGDNMPINEVEDLLKKNKRKEEVLKSLEDAKTTKENLKDVIAAGKEATIRVSGKVYRGTTVEVCEARMVIGKPTSMTKYGYNDGMLTTGPLT